MPFSCRIKGKHLYQYIDHISDISYLSDSLTECKYCIFFGFLTWFILQNNVLSLITFREKNHNPIDKEGYFQQQNIPLDGDGNNNEY